LNILFYTPFNSRSRDTESLMEAFIKQGHSVFLLTQADRGIYHEHCEKSGVKTFTKVIRKYNSILYFLQHAIYLAKFCRKNKIDILYAHLENASFSAVIAQYFMKTKVIACRHVIDEAYYMGSRKFILLTRLVYWLAKEIIVVSHRCKEFMIAKENIPANKIKTIYLAYNFNLYEKPDDVKVDMIRKSFASDLFLLSACRLIKGKRAHTAIKVVERLIADGINVKLVILGKGPQEEELRKIVRDKNLEENIFFPGFVLNVQDYIAACSILVHPSLQDSSSVIIKEAGLNYKTVIACSGIGDVDDYLVDQHNAFLVSIENTEEEMYEVIKNFSRDTEKLKQMGIALHKSVTERFDIKNIIGYYNKIHADINS
jgi:glycosyltransferase involved in cell wall biosynthesis